MARRQRKTAPQKATGDNKGPFRIKVEKRDEIDRMKFVPGRTYTVDKSVLDQLGDNAVEVDG